jgi:hypothetical protein
MLRWGKNLTVDLSIPDPWAAVVLVFGAYRLTRLFGWDDWPPIYRVRAWATGERWVPEAFADPPEWPAPLVAPTEEPVEMPGKTPESEVSDVRVAYSRPTFAHLVHCPFCLGWWVSLATYAAWNLSAGWTLWLIAPFALSGAVGLLARNLDP